MLRLRTNNDNVRSFGYYSLGLITCLITMYMVLELWNFDITIPYVYNGDGLSSGLLIKGMIDHGWFNYNPQVGAPFGLEMYDYTILDGLHYFLMKIISFFYPDYTIVMNTYYLLIYPLVMISAMYVFKQLKISFLISICGSLVYTFLPYHLMRAGHLFLIAYYLVPLMILVLLWIGSEDNLLIKYDDLKKRYKLNILNRKTIISLIVVLLISSGGVYYAFFSCFFLVIVGIMSSINEKKWRVLIVSSTLIFIIIFGVLLNASPNIYHKYKNGENLEVSSRNSIAAETYGLKIIQLLLPATNHRLSYFAEKKGIYNNEASLVNENDSSTLGVIGATGFLALIFTAFFIRDRRKNRMLQNLAVLNLSAVLLGTIGGLSVVFAMLVSAQIRGYNRISIFIAFFSILFILVSIDYLYRKYIKNIKGEVVYSCVIILGCIVGLWDQTNSTLVPSDTTRIEFNNDKQFVEIIENMVPDGAMIYQLPYVSFPEGEHLNNMGNYDLLKGYLHSDSLKWSFGGMRNREGDLWQRGLIKKPLEEAVEIVSLAGYEGIYIDRAGYSQEFVAKLEKQLSNILSIEPIVSDNNRLIYYNMKDYNQIIYTKYGENHKIKKEEALVYVPSVVFNMNEIESWQFVKDMKGYKVLQFDAIDNMPLEQYDFIVERAGKTIFKFDDSFTSANKYSYRHWENPKHFVMSISDEDTGWDEEYIPNSDDIIKYINHAQYYLKYNATISDGQLTFIDQRGH